MNSTAKQASYTTIRFWDGLKWQTFEGRLINSTQGYTGNHKYSEMYVTRKGVVTLERNFAISTDWGNIAE